MTPTRPRSCEPRLRDQIPGLYEAMSRDSEDSIGVLAKNSTYSSTRNLGSSKSTESIATIKKDGSTCSSQSASRLRPTRCAFEPSVSGKTPNLQSHEESRKYSDSLRPGSVLYGGITDHRRDTEIKTEVVDAEPTTTRIIDNTNEAKFEIVNTSHGTGEDRSPASVPVLANAKDATSVNQGPDSPNIGTVISLPPGPEVLKTLFTDFDALKRLKKEEGNCFVNTKRGCRCGSKIRNENITIIQTLIYCLHLAHGVDESAPILVQLIDLAACKLHQREAKGRMKRLTELERQNNDQKLEIPPKEAHRTNKIYSSPPEQNQRTHYLRSGQKYLGSAPKFFRYSPPRSLNTKAAKWVWMEAQRSLTQKDVGSGNLYVYWNQANFGMCKIGFTTRNIGQRLHEWECKCKHKAELLDHYYSIHVRRLETLVHAELNDRRFCEQRCAGCSSEHREWFQAGPTEIREVVDRWVKWMKQEPYENEEGAWKLRACFAKQAEKSIAEIDAMESESAPTPTNKTVGAKSRTPSRPKESPPRPRRRKNAATTGSPTTPAPAEDGGEVPEKPNRVYPFGIHSNFAVEAAREQALAPQVESSVLARSMPVGVLA